MKNYTKAMREKVGSLKAVSEEEAFQIHRDANLAKRGASAQKGETSKM